MRDSRGVGIGIDRGRKRTMVVVGHMVSMRGDIKRDAETNLLCWQG